jgi:hypothetical protein
MPTQLKLVPKTWRNVSQILGHAAKLDAAINACNNGAYVTIDLKTARNLLDICAQAIHTEKGHGNN